MSRRASVVFAVLVVLSLLMSACAAPATTVPTTAAPTAAPTTVSVAAAPTTAPTVAPATEAPKATAVPAAASGSTKVNLKGMKVAMIMPGSIDDQSWNTGGYNALQKLKTEFGVETAYIERVGVASVEAALRDYANQGYNLVVAHSFNYGDAVKKVAADFPKVAFAWSQGYPPMPENVAAYNAPLEESAYLCGMIGGLMTKSNKLGYIGGADTPQMVAALGGYYAGARLVNPKAEVISTFPGVWDDVQKGKESAQAQFAAGVDFMMGRGDGLAQGVLEAAKEKKIFAVGDMIDQNSLAPKLIVTSTIWDLSVSLEKMLEQVAMGSFKGGMFVFSMKDNATDVAAYHGLVPDDVAAKVDAVRKQIKDGTFTVPVFEKVPTVAQVDAAAKPTLP